MAIALILSRASACALVATRLGLLHQGRQPGHGDGTVECVDGDRGRLAGFRWIARTHQIPWPRLYAATRRTLRHSG